MADEAKELNLLKNVENRIVFAQNDAALQTILKTFLCPMLLKLESPHAAVREKTISICQHINTRIKPSGIQLPVAALLAQFQGANSGLLLKNFDLMYIQRGLERVPTDELKPLLPGILHAFDEISAGYSRTMFQILLNTLSQLPSPPARGSPAAAEYRQLLDLGNHEKATVFLSQKFEDLLLLILTPFQSTETGPGLSCPGLSAERFEFLTLGKRETFSHSRLSSIKQRVLEFIAVAGFSDRDLYFPFLVAAGSDSGSQLINLGEDGLKRLTVDLDHLEISDTTKPDEKLMKANETGVYIIQKLYNLYLGIPETNTSAARASLKSRVLNILSKSILALKEEVVSPTKVQRLVEEGLLGDNPEYNFKFRSSVFTFLVHVTRLGGDRLIQTVGYVIVENIRTWIYADGWPRSTSVNTGQLSNHLRSQGYITIGLLARRVPAFIVENDLQILRFLLSAVRGETKEMRSSAEEAISSILPCFSLMTQTQRKDVKELAFQSLLEDADTSGWGSYLKIANRASSFGDPVRIWMCLLACATTGAGSTDASRDLIDDGRKALHPYWFGILHPRAKLNNGSNPKVETTSDDGKMDIDQETPEAEEAKFQPLLTFLLSNDARLPKAFENRLTAAKSVCGVPIFVLPEMVTFLRSVLLINCLEYGVSTEQPEGKGTEDVLLVDGDWDDKISSELATSDQMRTFVRRYIENTGVTSNYFELLLRALLDTSDAPTFGNILMEFFPLLSWQILERLLRISSQNQWAELNRMVWQGKRAERESASYLLGMFKALSPIDHDGVQTKEWLDLHISRITSWESCPTTESNRTHGSIIAVSYYFSRLNVEAPYKSTAASASTGEVSKTISAYIDITINSRDTEFRDAAIVALTQLCYFKVVQPSQVEKDSELFEKLRALGKSGHEKAIIALGALSLVYPAPHNPDGPSEEKDKITKIKEILTSVHDNKMPELSFATGEALSILAAGWDSQILARKMDLVDGKVSAAGLEERENGQILSNLVSELLEMRTKGGSASFRKAACVWLLSMVQYCGHLDQVRERFEDIHTAFRLYLTDREEFVQETASRGLTKVYELGDKSLKEELVRNLVSSFTGTTKTLAGQVQADTQLFEPGALPTGDGSVSTYKDILSLASEVGDSSLVYKFMSLASHSAMWSSRAAFGRFGLGTIMSNSEEMFAENPKLYAKLFRYRFDPNPNVQRSMNDIWKALVKNPSATIDKYFDNIMEDLLKTIIDREWRTREASCGAIADLIQGRQPSQYEKHIQNIWTMSFKVLDDIKASVREAAMKLCRTLTKSLIHTVSDEHNTSPKDAKKALDNIMPFLMGPNGLENQAEDAQMLALKTLLDLVKKCGRVLRPYVPDMIDQFLNLLSSLEPQAINYLHLNAAKYNLTEDKIDAARLSSVRTSPMMDAIERCLDIADADVMKVFIPRLNKAIKKVVGMPSKVGCSRVVVTLVIRHSFLFRPYANDTLKVMSAALVDRNETVSASYAAACGYLARLASDEAVIKLLQYSQKLYFEQQEERMRVLSASVLNAISKHASDRFQALASDILPFAFIAKHDPEESVAEEYSKCWSDNTGGSGAVKLYLPEIAALAGAHLDSARWTIKQTAALSIADICVVLGPDLTQELLDVVYPLAVRSVAGKSYPSKYRVLEGFAALCTSPKFTETQKLKEVSKIFLREANRNNKDYRPHAFDSLAKFLRVQSETNLYDEIVDIVGNVFEAGAITDEDEMDTDTHGKSSERLWQITLASSLQLLASSMHKRYPDSASQVETLLALVEKQLLPSCSRDVKTAAIELVERILSRLQDNGPSTAVSPVDPKTWNKSLVQLWTNLNLVSKGASSENEKIRKELKAATEKLCILMGRLQVDGDSISELVQARDQVNQFLGQT
ncbi:proteasome component M29 [Orbilia oligospora]|nr:proteasome component M29 [Orbilia oligospora]KAF3252827.1 proteasome component M29 [Orbilia oligospora]KAF3293179.1 proteasome component M29 [Orbilia oligospora]